MDGNRRPCRPSSPRHRRSSYRASVEQSLPPRPFPSSVKQLSTQAGPALHSLPALTAGLKTSVEHLNTVLVSANSAYGDNSHFSRQLERLMAQLNDMAQSFRSLADLLTSHPEALIRGRTNSGVQQ